MRRRASHVIRPVRGRVVRFRLAALFAAQFFDLGTFSLMVDRHGVAAEANPIVAQGFADWGMVLVVVAKLALSSWSARSWSSWPDTRSPASLGLAAVVTVVAVVAGFTGGVSNLATLLTPSQTTGSRRSSGMFASRAARTSLTSSAATPAPPPPRPRGRPTASPCRTDRPWPRSSRRSRAPGASARR